MSNHVINRFDFETICAGVLRLINEPSLLTSLNKHLKPEYIYYQDQAENIKALRRVIKVVKKLYSNREDVSFQSVDSNITPSCKDEDEGKKTLNFYRMWRLDQNITDKVNDEGSFEVFLRYLKITKIVEVGKGFSEKFQAGDVDEAANEMQAAIQDMNTIGAQVYESFSFIDNLDIINSKKIGEVKTKVLTIGCEGLDHAIGGFEPQTLNLFMSTTNGGKTMFCHHVIKRCIELKIHAFVACVEDRSKSFRYKSLACLTGIPINRLKNANDLTNEEIQLIKEKSAELEKYIKVVFVYGQSVEAIHKISDDYDMECKIKGSEIPIVNIVDYTGHIASRAAGDKNFEKMRNAYAARKDYALKNNKIGIDFAQVNREGNKRMQEDKLLSQSDLAGAYDLSQVCDNIVSINRDSKDMSEFKCRLHVSKCRDGAVGVTVRVRTEFNKARYIVNDWEWSGRQPFDISEVKRVEKNG